MFTRFDHIELALGRDVCVCVDVWMCGCALGLVPVFDWAALDTCSLVHYVTLICNAI